MNVGWVIGPMVICALWVMYVLSLSARGWRGLAVEYESEGGPAEGEIFRPGRTMVGSALYGFGVFFAITPDGLRLWTFPMFRPGHPPLLVPWADIERTGEATIDSLIFGENVAVRFKKVRRIRVCINEEVVRRLEEKKRVAMVPAAMSETAKRTER
jgi:hypothetical protein